MTAQEQQLAYDLGYLYAKELHTWDNYKDPRDTFFKAKESYMLDEEDYPHFKQGVLDYIAKQTL